MIAHIGLTPQTSPLTSGYRLHGQSTAEASRLLDDALRVQDAGASAVVLEKIPSQLARFVTETLHIPTIGIGAGPHCDAQVLVSTGECVVRQHALPAFRHAVIAAAAAAVVLPLCITCRWRMTCSACTRASSPRLPSGTPTCTPRWRTR